MNNTDDDNDNSIELVDGVGGVMIDSDNEEDVLLDSNNAMNITDDIVIQHTLPSPIVHVSSGESKITRSWYTLCSPKRLSWSFWMMSVVVFALVITVVVLALNRGSNGGSPTPSPTPSPVLDTGSLSEEMKRDVRAKMNMSADPCEDFYSYACGQWIHDFDLGNANSYTIAFTDQYYRVQEQLLSILRSKFPFIGTFFEGCMNTDAIDERGTSPLNRWLGEINTITNVDMFWRVLGKLHSAGLARNAILTVMVDADWKYGNPYRLMAVPSGLTVSNYSSVDSTLFTDMERALELMGFSLTDARDGISNLLSFEESIANEYRELDMESVSFVALAEETRDIPITEFVQNTSVRFDLYMQWRDHTSTISTVSPLFPNAFSRLATIIGGVPIDTLKWYLRWHLFYDGRVGFFLPGAFRNVTFSLLQNDHMGDSAYTSNHLEQLLRVIHPSGPLRDIARDRLRDLVSAKGIDIDAFRVSICQDQTVNQFTDLVAHEWIIEDFPPQNEKFAKTLLSEMNAAIRARIQTVPWLDDTTRAAAILKLENIAQNVGYSNDWVEYSSLLVTGVMFDDYVSVSEWRDGRSLIKWNTKRDRFKMSTEAYFVQNAYYDPSANSINLLAGLMSFPMFDPQIPMALNLAGYGMVIGHEIFHGFDSSGRLFNGTGALVDWWTPEAGHNFGTRALCLVNQYSSYTVTFHFRNFDFDVNVDGWRTLGENIADNGGLRAAYEAARRFMGGDRIMDDFTNEQLFFLWYAQGWCTKQTNEGKARTLDDEHSPARYRVNGPAANLPQFASAFNCAPKEDACEVW